MDWLLLLISSLVVAQFSIFLLLVSSIRHFYVAWREFREQIEFDLTCLNDSYGKITNKITSIEKEMIASRKINKKSAVKRASIPGTSRVRN